MLAKRRMPQMSMEKVPTDFYILMRKYWCTYPKTGPVAMPIFTIVSTYVDQYAHV